MTTANATQKSSEKLYAQITRKGGKVERRILVSATYASPLKNAYWRLVGKPWSEFQIRRVNSHTRSR
jgi:hypothetical protein